MRALSIIAIPYHTDHEQTALKFECDVFMPYIQIRLMCIYTCIVSTVSLSTFCNSTSIHKVECF